MILRGRRVLAFSILRGLCCAYTFFVVLMKLYYRVVVGTRVALKSAFYDVLQIFLGLYPVIQGYNLQNELLSNMDEPKVDIHNLARQSQVLAHLDGFFILFLTFRII